MEETRSEAFYRVIGTPSPSAASDYVMLRPSIKPFLVTADRYVSVQRTMTRCQYKTAVRRSRVRNSVLRPVSLAD
jgi:hypothetical protein